MFFRHREKLPNGVIEDPRSDEEKAKDYRIEEVATFNPIAYPKWEDVKPKIDEYLDKLPVRNQGNVGSCLSFSTTACLGMLNLKEEGVFIEPSPADIYARRKNQNSAGMYFQDAMDINVKHGATLEYLFPTPRDHEFNSSILSNYKKSYGEIAQIYKPKNYFTVNPNIDEVAQLILQGNPVELGTRIGYDEWERITPVVRSDKTPWGHGIASIVNGAFIKDGQKTIMIYDSHGTSTTYRGKARFLTENWFKNRIFWAGVFRDLENDWFLNNPDINNPKPKYNFTKDLLYSMMNYDVIRLQDCLKWLGYFSKSVDSTGYYGVLTSKAVLQFQLDYKVDTPEELNKLEGHYVGPKTRKALNNLFR